MTKMTYTVVRDVVESVTRETYGSSARAHYTLGAFEAMLSHMIADLPKHKQAEAIRSLEALQKRVVEIV